jgi:hypothetical protein
MTMPNYGYSHRDDDRQGSRSSQRDRDEYGRFRSDNDDDRSGRRSSGRGEPFGGYEGRSEGGYRSSHMQERDERGRFAGEDDRHDRGGEGRYRTSERNDYGGSDRYDRNDRSQRSDRDDRDDRGERYDRELWRGREGAREGWYSRENGGWSGGSSQSYRDRDDDGRRSQGGYRGSNGLERDENGRFMSERDRGGGRQRGWEDEDRGRGQRSYGSSSSSGHWRERDDQGRFTSDPDRQGRYDDFDDDRGTSHGMNMNSRGWDDEGRGSRGGRDDGRSRSAQGRERDEQGRFRSDDDRDDRYSGSSGGRYGGGERSYGQGNDRSGWR